MRKLWIIFLTLTLWASASHAATRTLAAAGGACTAGGSWVGGVAPTAADDALLTSASGPMTVDTGCVMRSVNLTGYTNTVTHTAGVTWTIGDATAGLGNVALEFPASGWTYTLGDQSTSAITFVSTSATVQTVNFGGKTSGSVTFNASSNGSWQYTGSHIMASATALCTLTKGTLDFNGRSVTFGRFVSNSTNVRALTTGAATITVIGAGSNAWDMSTTTNLTATMTSSTLAFTGIGTQFQGGGLTYATVTFSSRTPAITGANTFGTLSITLTSGAGKTGTITFSANQTISGTLTLAGNSPLNRAFVTSDTLGASRTLTAATVTVSNADFRDITGAGAGSWNLAAITGLSGDCGGNSGITFTTPATQTATGTASFTWSTHGWTSRVPLPQDDVVISNAFIAGRVVTGDMPRLGKSINWTGTTGTPDWSMSTAATIYGSVTKIAGMTQSGTTNVTFEGRGAFTFTNAGVAWTNPLIIAMVGGSLTLSDALVSSNTLTHTNGTFADGGFASTFTTWTSTSGLTRAVTSTGTMTLSSTGAVFTQTATGLTYSGAGSTIALSDTSATSKTFAGGGLSYGALSLPGGGTGSIDITGANTFAGLTIGAPKTVRFTAATTTTLGAAPTCTGSSGNVITLSSITAATHTLSLAAGTVSCDYLNLTNSIATGGASWYAGANSTDGGGNAGWTFTAPPAGGNTGAFFQLLAR